MSAYQQLYQSLMQQLSSDIASGALQSGSSAFAKGAISSPISSMSSPIPPPPFMGGPFDTGPGLVTPGGKGPPPPPTQPLPFGGVIPGGFKGKGPPLLPSGPPQHISVQGDGGHYATLNGVPYGKGGTGTESQPFGKGFSAAHHTFASSPFYPTYHKTCHSCGFAANLQRYRWCNRCRAPFGVLSSPIAGGPQLLSRQAGPPKDPPGAVLPTTYAVAKSDPYATFVSPSPTQVPTGPPSTSPPSMSPPPGAPPMSVSSARPPSTAPPSMSPPPGAPPMTVSSAGSAMPVPPPPPRIEPWQTSILNSPVINLHNPASWPHWFGKAILLPKSKEAVYISSLSSPPPWFVQLIKANATLPSHITSPFVAQGESAASVEYLGEPMEREKLFGIVKDFLSCSLILCPPTV